MRKVAIISFLVIIAGSCSITRKADNVSASFAIEPESKNLLENVTKQNISSNGFFIQKAEIEFNNQNGKQKFLAVIKFEYPDKYLISLKNRTGIEGARIYITKDSIIVNDRINKKTYFGTELYLRRKYGINQSLLPLIFGDLLVEKNRVASKEMCIADNLEFNCVLRGVTLNYNIDCRKNKSTRVSLMTNYLQERVKLSSDGFVRKSNILIPRITEVEDSNTNTKIRVRFTKIEFPWNGKVKFVKGRGYELIELL